MRIVISDPVYQTLLFALMLGVVFLWSFVPKKNYTSQTLTQELKGFAILTVLFNHIGYFLSTDSRFLFPFSILAGVGVNLFFFLSGYGITASQMKKNESVHVFYRRRLLRLFVPLWMVLGLVFMLDAAILHKTYSPDYIIRSLFGVFVTADLYTDVNSPLWYFSLILLYYLLFPVLFNRKAPWLTAFLLFVAVMMLVSANIPMLSGVIGLYKTHLAAFPLGVCVAWLVASRRDLVHALQDFCKQHARHAHLPLVALFMAAAVYFAVHSHVGDSSVAEQGTSLLVMFSIMLLFFIKKRESRLLSMAGLYSYEIYLFHWPLMYRYDFLYPHLPAAIATLGYFVLFIALAWVLKKCSMAADQLLIWKRPLHQRAG